MAGEDSSIAVVIKAVTDDFDAKTKKSMRSFYKELDDIKKQLGSLGGANDNAANKAVGGFNKTSQAAGQLSFQLNDIATSLAGGASPFQVMMQQGSQVTQVFAGMGGGIKGVFSAIGGAVGSMINPITALTFGFIFLAGKAVEYFTGVDEGSKKAEQAFQSQIAALEGLTKKYEQFLSAGTKGVLLDIANEAQFRKVEQQAKEIADAVRGSMADAMAGMDIQLPDMFKGTKTKQQISDISDALLTFRTTWNRIIDDLRDGKNTVEETTEAIALLRELEKAQPGSGAQVLIEYLEKQLPLLQKAQDREKALNDLRAKGMSITDQQIDAQDAFNKALEKMGEIAKVQLTDAQSLLKTYEEAMRQAMLLTDAEAQRRAMTAADVAYDAGVQRISDEATDKEIREFVRSRIRGMIQQESSGNANAKNPKSSASGLGQFIDTTWLRLFPKVYPALAAGASREQQLGFRFDPEISRRMTEELAVENVKAMKAAGTVIVDGAVYLAHFLGEAGARRMLAAAPGASSAANAAPSAVRDNAEVFAKHPTVASMIEWAAGIEGGSAAAKEAKKTYTELVAEMNAKLAAQERENAINANSVLTTDEKTAALQREAAAQEKAKIELQLNNAALEENGVLTDAMKEKNAALAQSYADAGLKAAQMKTEQVAATKRLATEQAEMVQLSNQIAQMGQTAISGLITDLRNGVSAGEAFNNMLNRILDSLINMALQSLFSQKGIGGVLTTILSGISGVPVPAGASGGIIGQTSFPKRVVSPSVFNDAPSMARGGIVGDPNAVPIIAHKGEMVIPKHLVGRGGGGVTSNSYSMDNAKINIDMSGSGVTTANSEDAKKWGARVQKIIQLEMVRESRPGGLLRRVPG